MNPLTEPWMRGLEPDDWAFIKRFVLASGSLKRIAADYQVSYPTVRLRLDRLIAKIDVWNASEDRSTFELSLRAAFAEGKLDRGTFKSLLDLYLNERGELHDHHHESGHMGRKD